MILLHLLVKMFGKEIASYEDRYHIAKLTKQVQKLILTIDCVIVGIVVYLLPFDTRQIIIYFLLYTTLKVLIIPCIAYIIIDPYLYKSIELDRTKKLLDEENRKEVPYL